MTTTAISTRQFIEEYAMALSGLPKTEALIDKYVSDPALKEHILEFETGFPEYQIVPESVLVDDDQVALRGKLHGTHKGMFAGIPPTGKEITENIAVFYRVEDQKISKFWLIADVTKLLAELRG